MAPSPEHQVLQPRTSLPNGVRKLADDTRLVFLSDSHIGGDPGRDIFESPAELTALLKELSALDGPVELVLAGDFFDFLAIGDVPAGADRASLTISRPEYGSLFATLRHFAAGVGRHVVYLPGNHDAEMWWNPAIQETLRQEGLVHEFALSYAACFTSQPDRVVYCEHGNQFDPANAIAAYDDPLDTPSATTSSPT
jgi:UDP-2,3-diacylglucosamine pyrophosphatase LpxH